MPDIVDKLIARPPESLLAMEMAGSLMRIVGEAVSQNRSGDCWGWVGPGFLEGADKAGWPAPWVGV